MDQATSILPKQLVIVIIADSRGAGLQAEIDSLNKGKHKISVFVHKGKGIVEAVKLTSKTLVWMAPDHVIVLAGICDVTQIDRTTRVVSLREMNKDLLIDRFKGQMDIIRHHLSIFLTEKKHKLTFCHVIGMDLALYNHQPGEHPHQTLLDEMITDVNHSITAFNEENEVITPWTAKEVHRNKKGGKKSARYQKLAPDGLHLTDEMREKWAALLINVIDRTVYDKTE